MALFKVTNVIDGNTIEVDGWAWGDYRGKKVKIQGYDVSNPSHQQWVKSKLQTLLENKSIELKKAIRAEKGVGEKNDVIYCSVFLNGINIENYFGELTT